MNEFNDTFLFKDEPDETTPKDADNFNIALNNTRAICSQNAGSHNSIFRGADVTKYFDDGSLWTRISSGKFIDLFVGDYIVKNNTTWRIAGFDIYLNRGRTALTKHHAVIVPDTALTTARMNDSNTTDGGAAGSEMYTKTLDSILSEYITPIFGEHVLQHDQLLTTGIGSTLYNRLGTNTGASNAQNWVTTKLDLMNEIQIFGCVVWSSSGFEIGSDNIQFPLFKLAPQYIKIGSSSRLRTIVDKTHFAVIDSNCYINAEYYESSSESSGVRPYFYID